MPKWKVTRTWENVTARTAAEAIKNALGKPDDVNAERTSEPTPAETEKAERSLDLFGNRIDAMHERIERELQARGLRERAVYYSAYKGDAGGKTFRDNLDDIAVTGTVRLISDQQDWISSEHGGKAYVSDLITNPTWLDVACCASESIHETKDTHHQFLETIYQVKGNEPNVVYRLSFGS